MSVPPSPALGKAGARRAEPYPTNTNTRPPRSNRPARGIALGLPIKRKRLVIHLISCTGVPQVLSGPWAARMYYVIFKGKVTFGSALKIRSSRAVMDQDSSVIIWDEELYLEHMHSTTVTIQVIAPHTIGKSIIAQTTEKAVDLHSKRELTMPLNSGDGYCTLHLTTSENGNMWDETQNVLSRLPSPAASPLLSRADGVASGMVHIWKTLLDKIDDIADAVEALSQIHPYAQIAWSVIGAGYKLAKNQQQRDDKLASLIEAMQSTYSAVSSARSLSSMRPQQEAALIALMKQTTECGYFIIDYMRKSFFTRAFQGLLSNVDKVINDYCSRFTELRSAFTEHSTVATQVLVQLVLDKTEGLEATVELIDMQYTKNARWRSGKQCMPGTRTEMISCILDWANLPEYQSSRALLLTGSAGTGKSSVAHSVSRFLEDLSRLGASYCFERSDTANHRPDMLFPTMARDLSDWHPLFKRKLARTAKSATLRATSDLNDQFENLILKPLSELAYVGPLVIVIDAVDESASPKDRRELLRILSSRIDELPVNIRFVFTSRPEEDIIETLGKAEFVSRLDMSDVHLSSTLSDIKSFVSRKLVGIDGQPVRLFTDEHHRHLAHKSEGLFQWAAVVCDIILHGDNMDYFLPDEDMLWQYERFSALHTDTSSDVLDELYRDILSRILPSASSVSVQRVESIYLQTFRSLMSRILAIVEPLSAHSLFRLLRFHEREKRVSMTMLRRLGALLTGVHDMDVPIRLLHSSFRDFLRDPSASGAYYIDSDASHSILALNCVDVLNEELCFNVCRLETSYALNEDIGDLNMRLHSNVSAPLLYAAQHWGNHLAEAASLELHFRDSVSFLLRDKFLFWLELLSLQGTVHVAVPALISLRSKTMPKDLDDLIADYIRFIRVFNLPITSSAPHVYVSAYALAPSASLVRRQRYSSFLHHLVRVAGPWNDWPRTNIVIGTEERVLCVAISPDGRWIASSSAGNMVYLWNAETGKLVGEPLTGHTSTVACVSFSSDGYHVVSGSHDMSLRSWSIDKPDLGASVGIQFIGHSDRVNTVAFSPGSHCIASGSDDTTVRVWNTDGMCLLPPLRGHSGCITSLTFSHDGQWLASASVDGSICVWETVSGVPLRTMLNGRDLPITSLAFSPHEPILASGCLDGSLCIWDARTGEFMDYLDFGHARGVTSLAYSPDGRRIVSASEDRCLCIWDTTQAATTVSSYIGHTGTVNAVAFSLDGRQIVSGADDKTIRIWRADNDLGIESAVDDDEGSISFVALSTDGTRRVTQSRDQSMRVWDTSENVPIGSALPVGEITCVALSPNGRWTAVGSADGNISIWDIGTGSHECSLNGHTDYISALSFMHDERQIVSASHDSTLRIWDAYHQALVFAPLEASSGKIASMTLSPDDRMIVSGSLNGVICLWDAQRGRLMRALNAPTPIHSVAFAPNGRFIASGAEDCSVRVWNAITGEALWMSSLGHTDAVTSIAFTQDGCRIISGSNDHTIRVWSVHDGALLDVTLIGHTGAVTHVVAQPTRRGHTSDRIISASNDRTVRLWSVALHTQQTHREFLFSPNPLHTLRDYPDISPSRTSAFSGPVRFTLTYEWWIMDVGQDPPHALLWIPPEMRDALYMPNTTRIIGDREYALDLSDFAHGACWAGCWQDATSNH